MKLGKIHVPKENKEAEMSQEAPMYIYATEMVGSYYSILDIKNKKILTVCGSGDQVLNAYFLGAKKVVGFDLNKRSELITLLKISALRELSYGEFLKFFGERGSNSSLDYGLYKKIQKKLSKKALRFFDTLYKKYGFDGEKIARSDYFRQRWDFETDTKRINLYLRDEQSYMRLREIMARTKQEFVQGNAKDIYRAKKLGNEKFDVINLSNVPNYFAGRLRRAGVKNSLMVFYREVILNLRKIISPSGIIFYYGYSPKIYPNRIAKRMPYPSRSSGIRKIAAQKGFKITIKKFRGTKENYFDKIIILKKYSR